MDRIRLLIKAMYLGSSLNDPAGWKDKTVKANIVALLFTLMSLAASWGFDVQLNSADLGAVAGVIIIVGNIIMQWTTSEKIGFKPKDGLRAPTDDGAKEGGKSPERDPGPFLS